MKKFCTLILEDEAVTSVLLSKALHLELPDDLVLTARSIAEGRLLLEEYPIDFFCLDVNLPDGSGIDFIYDVMVKNPDASVIVMTAEPLPEYRAQATAYEVLRFMEKPIDFKAVATLVRECRDARAAQARGNTGFFSASLSRLTVLDIVQLKCLNHATQVIDLIAPQVGQGRIHFQNGEIIHAETAAATGEAAVAEIVGWRGGRVREVTGAPPVERSIFANWQSLLLSAAQAADENRGA